MTDLPSGSLCLTRGAVTVEISWYSGCGDPSYRELLDVMQQADKLVAGWGKPGRVLRTVVNAPAK